MTEDYRIISPPRGEPRAQGDTGVRVRLRLSGFPSRRWSLDLGARLTRELVAHPGAAHLRVNVDDLVQGDEIVLDGVEDRDTAGLADALRRAMEAANRATAGERGGAPNVTQREADTVARHMPLGDSGQAPSPTIEDDPPCPNCGHSMPVTAGDRDSGDQLALDHVECSNCGARLVRDVADHADHGWRVTD